MKYYLGIDPGKSPAICMLDCTGKIVDCKLIKEQDKRFPFNDFFWVVEEMINRSPNEDASVVMELPHSVYGASSKANFQFGLSIGACMMSLEAHGCGVNYVPPKAWTSWIWEDKDIVTNKKGKGRDTKATSLNSAKRLLGDKWNEKIFLPTERSKVVNHNLVDAYLIAEYGRQLDS
jgi:hypothetical protein